MESAPAAVMERERLTAEMSFRGDDDAAQLAGTDRLPSIIIKIRRRLPDFARSVNLKYVKLGLRHGGSPTSYLPMLCVPVLASAAYSFVRLDVIYYAIDLLTCVAWLGTAMLLLTVYYFKRPRPVYLVEFACYKPDDQLKISKEAFLDMTESTGCFNDKALDFQTKITNRSALGDETYLPPGVQARPPRLNMSEARLEAEAVMFGSLDALFASTGINPRRDVRILIVNCSLFNPTPSLASMIIHHYKMREDVKSFNLGGMGCSAGLIAIDLAKDMLQAHPNEYAVVLSTENITLNWYFGNDRAMLLSNCIFRMGGAAALLSNRRADAGRAKYRLLHTVRTHKGATDECFNCVYQREDDGGKVGVSLARELMAVAGDALKTNITTLGPLVLPLTEQLKFLKSLMMRRVFRAKGVRPYIPNFRRAFEHFCVHAGGRAVLEEVQRSLSLEDKDMEPSKCALHRFGNTSSSSLWYELAYAEAKGRVKRGKLASIDRLVCTDRLDKMVAGCVTTDEYAVAVSADRMWKVAFSSDNKDAMTKACAGFIDAVDVEGDGGPGTLTTLTLSPAAAAASGTAVMKSRLVSRDGAARVIRSEMLEGGKVSANLKPHVAEAKIEEAGEGACVIKTKLEYERLDGGGALAPEDEAALNEAYRSLMKMIEAYLVANPAEYA